MSNLNDQIREKYVDINKIHEDIKELKSQLEINYLEEVRKLEWVNSSSFLFVEGIAAYGQKEYILKFYTKDENVKNLMVGSLMSSYDILGDDKNYMENLRLRRTYGATEFFELVTCNDKIFNEFLELTKPKITKNSSTIRDINVYSNLSKYIEA